MELGGPEVGAGVEEQPRRIPPIEIGGVRGIRQEPEPARERP